MFVGLNQRDAVFVVRGLVHKCHMPMLGGAL